LSLVLYKNKYKHTLSFHLFKKLLVIIQTIFSPFSVYPLKGIKLYFMKYIYNTILWSMLERDFNIECPVIGYSWILHVNRIKYCRTNYVRINQFSSDFIIRHLLLKIFTNISISDKHLNQAFWKFFFFIQTTTFAADLNIALYTLIIIVICETLFVLSHKWKKQGLNCQTYWQ
jgi:hypothetical protein